jgi:hypothetical protein
MKFSAQGRIGCRPRLVLSHDLRNCRETYHRIAGEAMSV